MAIRRADFAGGASWELNVPDLGSASTLVLDDGVMPGPNHKYRLKGMETRY